MHVTLQDDVIAITQNVFGPQESGFLDSSDSSDSSEDSDSSDELEGPNPEMDDLLFFL